MSRRLMSDGRFVCFDAIDYLRASPNALNILILLRSINSFPPHELNIET
jgi:hypothetical protein